MTASALFVDLYEIAMLRAYFELGVAERRATFGLFVRRLPPSRNFLLACGLADVLKELTALRYDEERFALSRLARLSAGLPRLARAFSLHRRHSRSAGRHARLRQ